MLIPMPQFSTQQKAPLRVTVPHNASAIVAYKMIRSLVRVHVGVNDVDVWQKPQLI